MKKTYKSGIGAAFCSMNYLFSLDQFPLFYSFLSGYVICRYFSGSYHSLPSKSPCIKYILSPISMCVQIPRPLIVTFTCLDSQELVNVFHSHADCGELESTVILDPFCLLKYIAWLKEKICINHLAISLKCRFLFSRSGPGSQNSIYE